MADYHSIAALAKEATAANKRISDMVMAEQAAALEIQPDEVYSLMKHNLNVMRNSVNIGSDEHIRSHSGLTGGAGFAMMRYAKGGGSLPLATAASASSATPSAGDTPATPPISGTFCATAIARSISVAECNAAMGKIVASPTAGSCGILPAAILTMMEERGASEESAVMALITAGAFVLVIANEASIAGAEGGCQAECGSAAGMAAAALVEMAGGNPQQCADACAMAIKNQLGLVCDPVAGLVEVPCVKRNAGGVMCAICAADMALAGIKSVITVDEVIEAMRAVGDSMPEALRETACGGLAVTATGLAFAQKIFGNT